MNFMDRTAIGNARLYNMEEDLGLGEGEYQLAVSVLFITYCLFEVVSSPNCRLERASLTQTAIEPHHQEIEARTLSCRTGTRVGLGRNFHCFCQQSRFARRLPPVARNV